jgi:hypothetical protein
VDSQAKIQQQISFYNSNLLYSFKGHPTSESSPFKARQNTATSVVRKDVLQFFAVRPPLHTRATKYISLHSDCRTVIVAFCHVWKVSLHFIFYYMMRHEPYERRTTDVAVCVPALSVTVFFIASGVGLSPLYCCHFWPIVPASDDRWGWLWSNWWNEDGQGKPKYSEKTCPSVTLSTTNPIWKDPGSNPGRRGGKPATNRLSYGATLLSLLQDFLICAVYVSTVSHTFLCTFKWVYVSRPLHFCLPIFAFVIQVCIA